MTKMYAYQKKLKDEESLANEGQVFGGVAIGIILFGMLAGLIAVGRVARSSRCDSSAQVASSASVSGFSTTFSAAGAA